MANAEVSAPMIPPGARLRAALAAERPLQVVGAINAYAARLAAACGFKALYLSGGGVAANSLGVPDLGISTMDDVLVDIRRITDACDLPLLVDADTGWGGAFNIARTVRSFIKAGAVGELSQYRRFRDAVGVPILANITEFGRTPLFGRAELGAAGVDIILYCCAAYRAMNAAALATYEAIRRDGTQKDMLGRMQTREQLYRCLDYAAYEQQLDRLFAAGKGT